MHLQTGLCGQVAANSRPRTGPVCLGGPLVLPKFSICVLHLYIFKCIIVLLIYVYELIAHVSLSSELLYILFIVFKLNLSC